MTVRLFILLLSISSAAFSQVSSRDNFNEIEKPESWRIPAIKGGYPLKKFPKAKISGEKAVARDIGGKKNLSLEEFNRIMDRKVEEFYKRMKDEVKEDRKLARIMQKPQYSDPTYFGHKRKPTERPVGKRKFCKECGIVH